MPRLVKPSVKFKKSFLKDFIGYQRKTALEYDSWGKYHNKKILSQDFNGFVKFLRSQSKGKNLPKGYVPQSVFWLVEGQRFLGLLILRHRLTPKLKRIGGHIGYEVALKFQGHGYGNLILKLGLKKAKALGINNVLLTCDISNVRSKKVIELNGGKFAGKTNQGKDLPEKLRYWIKV